jgi:hypothetical protein
MRVRHHEPVVLVEQDESFGQCLDRIEQPQAGFLRDLLGRLPVGDVLHDAEHAGEASLRIELRIGLQSDPAHGAIGTDPAMLMHHRFPLGAPELPDADIIVEVVRMDEFQEFRVRHARCRRQSRDLETLPRPDRGLAGHVARPVSQFSDPLRVEQKPPAVRQLFVLAGEQSFRRFHPANLPQQHDQQQHDRHDGNRCPDGEHAGIPAPRAEHGLLAHRGRDSQRKAGHLLK